MEVAEAMSGAAYECKEMVKVAMWLHEENLQRHNRQVQF
jgi:hypothetical protein